MSDLNPYQSPQPEVRDGSPPPRVRVSLPVDQLYWPSRIAVGWGFVRGLLAISAGVIGATIYSVHFSGRTQQWDDAFLEFGSLVALHFVLAGFDFSGAMR